MDGAARQLEDYLQERTWYEKKQGQGQGRSQSDGEFPPLRNWRSRNPYLLTPSTPLIKIHNPYPKSECYAYFSAEWSCGACHTPGLGVLAGDHLKSSSDLGLPLVGVGLLYQQGYFAQYLNADGWQQERYPINDFYNLPLHLETQSRWLRVKDCRGLSGRTVYARVWRVQVGTVPLYMLDTNIEPNNPYDQNITDRLYGGDMICASTRKLC